MEFETEDGREVVVVVTHYVEQRPLGRWAECQADADGYVEREYLVLDADGREVELSQEDEDRIEAAIDAKMQSDWVEAQIDAAGDEIEWRRLG